MYLICLENVVTVGNKTFLFLHLFCLALTGEDNVRIVRRYVNAASAVHSFRYRFVESVSVEEHSVMEIWCKLVHVYRLSLQSKIT